MYLSAIRVCSQILTFHKRMSIIADTLRGARTHLHHFLLVAFLLSSAFDVTPTATVVCTVLALLSTLRGTVDF